MITFYKLKLFQEQLANFPAFDIPRFQKVFSTVTAAPYLSPQQSWSSKNDGYKFRTTNRNQSDEYFARKFHDDPTESQSNWLENSKKTDQMRRTNNEKVRFPMKMRENWKGKLNHGEALKHRERNSSHRRSDVLPKFDPRFPFDRAYKLLEDLRPPAIFKFPTASDYI